MRGCRCMRNRLVLSQLACSNRKWHHLAFEYPAEEKLAFDRFVTRASYALKEYEAVGCD